MIEIHECACFTHGFTVGVDDEAPIVYLSTWSHGTAGNKLGWIDRLRWSWQILWTGFPHDDEFVLEAEAAEKLAQALMGAAAEASAIGEAK